MSKFYWVLNGTKGYQEALTDIRKLVQIVMDLEPSLLASGTGELGTDPDLVDGVIFNGVEEAGHESFRLYNVPVTEGPIKFSFCKTDNKPYSVVVSACMAILKYHMREDININTDLGCDVLEEGMGLVSELLQIKLGNL